MARVRRTTYLFLYVQDGGYLDVGFRLRPIATTTTLTKSAGPRRIFALSVLCGEEFEISQDQLQLLLAIPSDDWIAEAQVLAERRTEAPLLGDLVEKGLVLTDGPEAEVAELRRRDEALTSSGWNTYAALFHFMSRMRYPHLLTRLFADWHQAHGDAAVGPASAAQLQMLERHGPPPSPFHAAAQALDVRELPIVRREGGLYAALQNRKTSRFFETHRPMTVEQLSTILYYVFGCHGYKRETIRAMRRTSPSGGAMHPVEAYPLVLNVDGLETGLYHYRVEDHALELIQHLDRDAAAGAASEFTVGQEWTRAASVLFVMTARFERNYWKYRQHERAYAVVLMDAGHLSQTLYLVCTELGLGPFVTAIINTAKIEASLGLDGIREGAIAVCGCGWPARDGAGWEPEFSPFSPRQTQP